VTKLGLGIEVKLVQYPPEAPKLVAAASKMSISHKGSSELLSIGDEEVEVWIKETLKRGHLSPWELKFIKGVVSCVLNVNTNTKATRGRRGWEGRD